MAAPRLPRVGPIMAAGLIGGWGTAIISSAAAEDARSRPVIGHPSIPETLHILYVQEAKGAQAEGTQAKGRRKAGKRQA